MMNKNTDAEYSGENVSQVDDYSADESEWDAAQFVQSTDDECARSGCEYNTSEEGDLFCGVCWNTKVLPELDVSAFTAQAETIEDLDDIEQIPVEMDMEN